MILILSLWKSVVILRKEEGGLSNFVEGETVSESLASKTWNPTIIDTEIDSNTWQFSLVGTQTMEAIFATTGTVDFSSNNNQNEQTFSSIKSQTLT